MTRACSLEGVVLSVGLADGANPHAVIAQVVMLAIVASFGAAGSRLIVGVGGAGQGSEAKAG